MPQRTDASAFAIEDYLYSVITAQTAVGQKLAGITNVERATPPQKTGLPSIGVAFDKFSGDVVGAGPIGATTYQRDANYTLTVAIDAAFSAATPDTEQQARLALRQYVDDGKGNGLLPLLKADPTFGGLADASWITALEIVPYQSRGAAAGSLLVAWVTLRARYRTR